MGCNKNIFCPPLGGGGGWVSTVGGIKILSFSGAIFQFQMNMTLVSFNVRDSSKKDNIKDD